MEKVSNRQLTGIIVMMIVGGILMSGGANRSMQDAWLAMLFSCVLAVPMFLVYARIGDIFPGKGFFEIANICFGRFFGGLITLFMSLYAFHLGAMAMKSFSEFNMVVSMPETPQLVTLMLFGATSMYILKKGIETLGRFTDFFLPIMLFLILLTNVLSLGNADVSNIFPVLKTAGKEFASDIFTAVTFPIGEAVLVMCLLGFKRNGTKNCGIFLYGLLFGGFLLVIETLRSILVLGSHTIALTYYPSYIATGVINIMDFFSRVEVVVSTAFLIAQVVKTCVCIYVFSSGIGSLVGSSDYKTLVIPTALAMISTALVIFKNTLESYEFLTTYRYYAPIFQAILPLTLWIGAELYAKREHILLKGSVKSGIKHESGGI